MKKFASRVYTTLITALVVFLAYGIISFAAEGKVQITDTTGKVGEEITIPVSISTAGEPIGDGSLTSMDSTGSPGPSPDVSSYT